VSFADELDISLSRDITERFKEKERSQGRHSDSELSVSFHLETSSLSVDFNIQVLASNNWPFGGQAVDYTVPTQIEGMYNRFNEFHGEVHK
jgi:cullin 1